MKTMALAALAAVLAVAPTAVARAGSDEPAPPVVRPSGDVQALLVTMTSNARLAREVLEQARSHRRADEVRCSDEALSRADVALRRGREDVQEMTVALTAHDAKAAATAMHRLEARAAASRDAAAIARGCIVQPAAASRPEGTQVIVHVSATLPPANRVLP
jgi:hypothetical protein